MTYRLSHRLFAEVFGTGVLTAAIVGSAFMAGRLTNDLAVIQRCVAVSCSTVLFVMLELLVPISVGILIQQSV